ncbi:MAG: hypothetical protein IJQ28_06835 [Clostridia bacterium]|nr:hypothetical protein [Clostridia bacterium]
MAATVGGYSIIILIIGIIVSLVFVFGIVNPFFRARGFALWFRIFVGLGAYALMTAIVRLALGFVFSIL